MQIKSTGPSHVVQENIKTYDDYYDKPSWWFKLRYDTQVKRKTIMHLFRQTGFETKNLKILEIGFGSGEVLFSFPTGCGIYGVEISKSAVKTARAKAAAKGYQQFDFKLNESNTLDFGDSTFDLVIASHVIEHVEDDLALLSEVRRVLRNGGIAIILVPIHERYPDPRHLRSYTPALFTEKAENSGFLVSHRLENELLYNLVRKFYMEDKERLGVLGILLASLFNIPAAFLPFQAYEFIDRMLNRRGFKPSQFGCVLTKIKNLT